MKQKKRIAWLTPLLFTILFTDMALAWRGGWQPRNTFGPCSFLYSWGWPGGLFWFLIGTAIIVGSISLFRRFFRRKEQGMALGAVKSRALDLLTERYAKGEISTDEFKDRKKIIEENLA